MTAPDLATVQVDTIDELNHRHDDDCRACSRDGCHELTCQHDEEENGCRRAGCRCPRWLADTDCPSCDGFGEVWFGVETLNGRVLDDSVTCRACGGTKAANR